jgi:hypothetical protein
VPGGPQLQPGVSQGSLEQMRPSVTSPVLVSGANLVLALRFRLVAG